MEFIIMQMGTDTKDSSKMVSMKEREYIFTQMEENTKEIGKVIKKMGLELLCI